MSQIPPKRRIQGLLRNIAQKHPFVTIVAVVGAVAASVAFISGLINIFNFVGLSSGSALLTTLKHIFYALLHALSAFGGQRVGIVLGVIILAIIAELAFFRRLQSRTKGTSWLPWLRLLLGVVLLAVVVGSIVWPGPRSQESPVYFYKAEDGTVHLTKLPTNPLEGTFPHGVLLDFQTNDPHFTCLNGQELEVYYVSSFKKDKYLAFNHCPSDAAEVGYWSFSVVYEYEAIWQGQGVPLTHISDDPNAIAKLPDAHKQNSLLSFFFTNDLVFSCLNNTPLPVYTAPKEYPGVLLAIGVCPDGSGSGTWSFKQPYHYYGTWQGKLVQLTLHSESKALPAGSVDIQSTIQDLQTDDPKYKCISGVLPPEVYIAPAEYPNLDIATFACPEGASGIISFVVPDTNLTYTADWGDNKVHLSAASPVLLDQDPLPTDPAIFAQSYNYVGQVTAFMTNDPIYACFEGESLFVWVSPTFYPGLYVVSGVCPGGYGLWTFPASS